LVWWANENAFATYTQARPFPPLADRFIIGFPHRLQPGTSPQALRIPLTEDTLPSEVLQAVAPAPPWLYPAFAFVPV
jgi:hypothetical protein